MHGNAGDEVGLESLGARKMSAQQSTKRPGKLLALQMFDPQNCVFKLSLIKTQ